VRQQPFGTAIICNEPGCHFKCYFKLNILFNTFVTGNHGKDGIVMPKKNLKITPKTLSAI
jgi:hypothetical protein